MTCNPQGSALPAAAPGGWLWRALAWITVASAASALAQPWPSFRGPGGSGVADGPPLPLHWDLPTACNVPWKTRIPGRGHSSPVVWGGRVFVTSAVDETGEPETAPEPIVLSPEMSMAPEPDGTPKAWRVYGLDQETGQVLWERTAHSGPPRTRHHPLNSYATPTAAVDGEYVVVFFGAHGLYGYRHDGEPVWKRDLGLLRAGYYLDGELEWGMASSPILHQGRIVVQCDVNQSAFLAAFDVADGRQLWRVERDDFPSWSTPAVYRHGSQSVVVTVAPNWVRSYDLATGDEIWRLYWGLDITEPAPVVAGELVYLAAGKGRQSPILAVRPGARGDLTLDGGQRSNRHVVWSVERGGPITPTPLSYRGIFYVLRDMGILTAYQGETGEEIYRQRLPGDFFASPVAANGVLYLTNLDGDVHLVAAGREFRRLATHSLGEPVMATPAISDGTLLFRTVRHLVALRQGAGGASGPAPDCAGRTPPAPPEDPERPTVDGPHR